MKSVVVFPTQGKAGVESRMGLREHCSGAGRAAPAGTPRAGGMSFATPSLQAVLSAGGVCVTRNEEQLSTPGS